MESSFCSYSIGVKPLLLLFYRGQPSVIPLFHLGRSPQFYLLSRDFWLSCQIFSPIYLDQALAIRTFTEQMDEFWRNLDRVIPTFIPTLKWYFYFFLYHAGGYNLLLS